MPQGEGTYGSKVGRPPENKNKSKSSKRNSKTARQNRLERNRDNLNKIEEQIIRDEKEREKRLLRKVDARKRSKKSY